MADNRRGELENISLTYSFPLLSLKATNNIA